jgi:DNA processing protein
MYLDSESILTLQNLRGFGAAAIDAVCAAVVHLDLSVRTPNDLYGLLDELIARRALKRVFLPDKDDFSEAARRSQRLLEQSQALGIGYVCRLDERFPHRFSETVDEKGKTAVPSVIFYKGDLSILDRPSLAVIGTREPTAEGKAAGEYYAKVFASLGVNIVSGLALGCDTAGHKGAIAGGGVTTAVLAHGLDTIYPPENEDLAAKILETGGLLLSEYPVGTPVNRYNLVARDRIQAGLSGAVLVIQTKIHGGTMHAVRAAQSVGKPVLVVDYKEDLGDIIAGNRFLKAQENGGAAGLRATAEQIRAEKEKYLSFFAGKGEESALTLF